MFSMNAASSSTNVTKKSNNNNAIARKESSSSSSSSKKKNPPPLISPLIEDNRKIDQIPISTALALIAFIPIWATTVVPLSISYQCYRAITRGVGNILFRRNKEQQEKKNTVIRKLDSGYVVTSDMIIPRDQRKYDIIVLGATGFTGKLAVRHLAKTYGVPSPTVSNNNNNNKKGSSEEVVVRWAIAGRSRDKLSKVLNDLADELNMNELRTNVDIIIVDTSIPSTMPGLVRDTRVIATTVGPYALYGSTVVEFCAKFGTHYVDITGEVAWVQAMLIQWSNVAQKTGSIIIPFCGHDSIPWDIMTYKMQEEMITYNKKKQQQQDNDDDDMLLSRLSFWDETIGGPPGGTLATVFSNIEGTANIQPPKSLGYDPFLRLEDGSISKYVVDADLPIIPIKQIDPWWNDVDDDEGEVVTTTSKTRWCIPFVMATINHMVVRWSYALRSQGHPKLIYSEVMPCPDFATAFVKYFGSIIIGTMMFNPITAMLLKQYIFPKPGYGPSMVDMETNHYLCIRGRGETSSSSSSSSRSFNKHHIIIESALYFPRNAGCIETSRMLIESGLCLALHEHEIPLNNNINNATMMMSGSGDCGGGFYPPSYALGDILFNRILQSGRTIYRSRIVVKTTNK